MTTLKDLIKNNVQPTQTTISDTTPTPQKSLKNLINTPAVTQTTQTMQTTPKASLKDLINQSATSTPIKQTAAKATAPAALKSAQKVATKAKRLGIVDFAVQNGIVPDYSNKSIAGKMGSAVAFPFQKILGALAAIPRTEAALGGELNKKGISDISTGKQPEMKPFDYSQYSLLEHAKKNLGVWDIGKEGLKNVAKAAVNTGEYANTSFAQLYKNMYPNTNFTKKFALPESWKNGNAYQRIASNSFKNLTPNENGNWYQRLTSGFTGSPADIAGLATDVAADPLTYFGGGVGIGGKTGVTVAEDVIKDGIKLLPKGAEIGLSKEGIAALNTFTKLPENIALVDNLASKATSETTQVAAKNIANQQMVNRFIESLPDVTTANKYIDYGGAKFMGGTIPGLEGYKIAQKLGKIDNTSMGDLLGKAFNEYSGVPDALKPNINYWQSFSETQKNQLWNDFGDVIKGSNKKDLSKVQDYLWQMGDVQKQENKVNAIGAKIESLTQAGSDIPKGLNTSLTKSTNTLEKYYNKIGELALNDKQLTTANNLQDFWKKTADVLKKTTGKEVNPYDFYTPIRYTQEDLRALKNSPIGAETPNFMKSRVVTKAQAERLGLQPKDLITSAGQRLYEQQRTVFRDGLLNDIKQFGSDVPAEGMTLVKDIPELKNIYLPEEYQKVLKNTVSQFFGDQATQNILKAYDKGLTVWKRWALATPGYHFRNFMSDSVSGLMQWGTKYLDPENWSDMTKILSRKHVPIKLYGGETRFADDIANDLTKSGLMLTNQTAVESKMAQEGFGKVNAAISKVSPAEWSLKLGSKREDTGRVVGYLIERKAGASDLMSTTMSKKVFFDYSHSLTPFEQNFVKRGIPFYTWLKNNLRRQVELLFTRTGAYSTIPKAMNFVENISQKPDMYDTVKPDSYKDLGAFITPLRNPGLPDWVANMLHKQKTTQAGAPLVSNPNLPFQDWSRLSPADLESSMSPFLKAIGELVTNKNVYYGSPIYSQPEKNITVANVKVPAPMQKALEKILPLSALLKLVFTKNDKGVLTMSPTMNYLANTFLPQYGLAQRGFGDTESTPFQNLSALTGLKFFPYNSDKSKTAYYNNFVKNTNARINQQTK